MIEKFGGTTPFCRCHKKGLSDEGSNRKRAEEKRELKAKYKIAKYVDTTAREKSQAGCLQTGCTLTTE